MNKKGSLMIARFIIVLFIFLVFLGLSPMLNGAINSAQEIGLGCSDDYTLICFIADASLPIMALILLTMLIGFLKKS
jgi:hypothetical protein